MFPLFLVSSILQLSQFPRRESGSKTKTVTSTMRTFNFFTLQGLILTLIVIICTYNSCAVVFLQVCSSFNIFYNSICI